MDSYRRHKPENKYCGMTKTLIDIDVRIFAREKRDQLMDRLAVIKEWYWCSPWTIVFIYTKYKCVEPLARSQVTLRGEATGIILTYW